jgi:hypothetical protein
VWEERLYDHLTDHVEAESAMLGEYEALADRCTGYVSYLLRVIGDDEARHHRFFEQLAASIGDLATLQPSADAVPMVEPEADPAAVLQAVEKLLDVEHNDEHALRELRKELDDVEDTTLWALLVDVMRLDTQKHIRILEFMRRHARQTLKEG